MSRTHFFDTVALMKLCRRTVYGLFWDYTQYPNSKIKIASTKSVPLMKLNCKILLYIQNTLANVHMMILVIGKYFH